MKFELLGAILNQEAVWGAVGARLRERLRKAHGRGRWRLMKGIGRVRLPEGAVRVVELHWYEAPGAVRSDLKIKRYVGET